MYLFQQNHVAISVIEDRNLHSTMYLFQHVQIGFYNTLSLRFTFHYVSISTFRQPAPCFCRVAFTFHYVSISTLSCCSYSRWSCIYIPLCIYFNLNIVMTLQLKKIHLHSTMYLFQQILPLRTGSDEQIYIPLCIYFNRLQKMCGVWTSKFTFHYVSISTSCTCYLSCRAYIIYIPLCIYFNQVPNTDVSQYYNLHSTMYLFQPKRQYR